MPPWGWPAPRLVRVGIQTGEVRTVGVEGPDTASFKNTLRCREQTPTVMEKEAN